MVQRIFIVPHDLTPVADKALQQAIQLSKSIESKIILVHIVQKESEINNAETSLQKIVSNHPSFTIEIIVKKGSIFTDIGKIADANKATAIIMGTHGAKGMQKVFGSFAMKVIISTSVPFMVIQEGINLKDFNRICFSIEANSESMQIMTLAGNLAKTYNAKIYIIAEKEKDMKIAKKIKNNLTILSKHMQKIEVDFHLELLENKSTWDKTVQDYASANSIDMFAYSYDSDRFLASNDKFSQSLLFNEIKIPALIINARKITASTYF